MELPRVDKKLGEAKYFLALMQRCEQTAFGERETFDFNFSAFLSATRSVDYRLRHEEGAKYAPWRPAWDSTHAVEAALIKFLVDERNLEVHEKGATHAKKETTIPIGNMYSDRSGTAYVTASPDSPRAFVYTPAYYVTIDGVERRAVEVCNEYVRLLDRIVAEFKAAHP